VLGHQPGPHHRGPGRSKWRWAVLLPAIALGTVACGATKAPQSAKAPGTTQAPRTTKAHPARPAELSDASSCASTQWTPTVYGTPHMSTVPAVEAVTVTPGFGGLLVSYKFKKPFVAAPTGVYDAWTVYLFQRRSDAGNVDKAVQLQIEDRGPGWEPSGWTLLATLGTANHQVVGNVRTNGAGDVIQTFFPAGFANLEPPFYWFAEQTEDRAYLPRHSRADFSVNGTITSDCPNGVMGPYGMPNGAKLIEVKT
jgi:hypothetical protein